ALTISGTGSAGSLVTEIGPGATMISSYFGGFDSIRTVVIQPGITELSYGAFEDCENLESVTLPNTLTSIGDNTFHNCASLRSITIPDSVVSIGEDAFSDSGLRSIYIGTGLETVGEDAFNWCSIQSVYVTDIDSWAQIEYEGDYYSSPLNSRQATLYLNNAPVSGNIVLSNGVSKIGDFAFIGCSGITGITIPNTVTSIGEDAFYGCTGLTSVTIPSSVTSIGARVFSGCTSMTSVTIQGSLSEIPDSAFRACSSLASITIPNGPTRIDGYAFNGCSSLQSITIPATATGIGACAFYNCTDLTQIVIPNGVTNIGYAAFYGCTSLESATLPSSLTKIEYRTFYNCESLESIVIPASITIIGEEAFMGCTSLESATLYSGNLVTIEKRAFKECSALESISIPDSVTKLGEEAFRNCTSVLSITIGDSLTAIPNNAFFMCSSVTSLTLGDSVTTINNNAFAGCQSMEYLYIGSSVESSFGTTIVNNLIGLKTIEVSSDNQYFSSDSNGVLFNKDKTEIICYPRANTRTSYTIPDGVTSVGRRGLYKCSNLSYLTIGSGLQSPNGISFETMDSMVAYSVSQQNNYYSSDSSGVLYNKDKTALIAFPQNKSVTGYVIPDSVTSIDSYAFCCNDSLTSFTVPDGITSIGYAAFWKCTALTSTELPDSVETIGSTTFKDCTALTSVTLPDNMKTISEGMFMGCSALTEITLPDSLETIGGNSFRDCTSLTGISIPANVTTIGTNAFMGCTSLEDLEFCDGFNALNNGFYLEGCTSLKKVYIPDSVTAISNFRVVGCGASYSIYCYPNSAAHNYAIQYFNNRYTLLVRADANNFRITNGTASIDINTITITANEGATQVNVYPTLKDGTPLTFSNCTGSAGVSKNGTLYAKGYATATVTIGSETANIIFDFGEEDYDIESQLRFANASISVENKVITLVPSIGATQINVYPTLTDKSPIEYSDLSSGLGISKNGTLYARGSGTVTATIKGIEYSIVFDFEPSSLNLAEKIRCVNASPSVEGTTITLTVNEGATQINLYPSLTDGTVMNFSNLSGGAGVSKNGTLYAKKNGSATATINGVDFTVNLVLTQEEEEAVVVETPIIDYLIVGNATKSIEGSVITLTPVSQNYQMNLYKRMTDGRQLEFSNGNGIRFPSDMRCAYAKSNASCTITVDGVSYTVNFVFS
ncbi:MAG: leucine-rich repeat domain-containing protein, partial [Clostridia bacterium]|nr:leucine-rich repeat domain-containing protein [Clostridia bacterium]